MDTSRPSAASTAPPNARTAVRAAAAQDSPATVGHRAGLTFTGTSRPTYIRWCLTVPLSRDICPGPPGIYGVLRGARGVVPPKGGPGGPPGGGGSRAQARAAGPSGRGDGAEQEADQLGGVGPGAAGQ